MIDLNFMITVRSTCNSCFSQCYERFKSCLISLYALFQRTLFTALHISQSFPDSASLILTNRSIRPVIKIGGVENAGNTCIFSTLLQEFAAEFDFYNSFLIMPLKQGVKELEKDFALRKQLQKHLYYCVKEIHAGVTVKKENIIILLNLLQNLGWNENPASLWRKLFQKIAPKLFPRPLSSPHKLYDKIISLFAEAYDPSRQIILLSKDSQTSFIQLFEQHSAFFSKKELDFEKRSDEMSNNISHTLWKICLDPNSAFVLQEQFQIQQHQLSLKLVHACRETPSGKHVVVYRKHKGHWVCCDDAQINEQKSLPSQNIHAVVYTASTSH